MITAREAMLVLSTALGLLPSGCGGDLPGGLLTAPEGTGPRVIWQLEARPLPAIPLPNDLATRADPGSPTGRRLNISTNAPTAMERKIRALANELDGFSSYGAISVSFDAPLDLQNIIDRHHGDAHPADDVILLIDVDPGSPDFGKRIRLDLGQGSFPLALARPDKYGRRDTRREVDNLLFDTVDEDENGNGALDEGEDSDADGYLDRPNVHPIDGHPLDDLVTFYERATRTLLARPLVPLRPKTRYAVVLTRHLVGEDGEPVRSPWPLVNHARQSAALAPLSEILPRLGQATEDVAFAWSFTTGHPTRDLQALRAGIYGHGRFARLAGEFPPDLAPVRALDEGDNPYLVPASSVQSLLATFGSMLDIGMIEITADGADSVIASLDNVAYFVLAEVSGPNLLADRNDEAAPGQPGDADEVWELDHGSGHAFYRPHKIPLLCAIPRADRGKGPPFPVALYQHGYGSTRLEMLAFAGTIARYGIATCTIDAYGHGLDVGEFRVLAEAGFKGYNLGPFLDAVAPGRARDLDNDGLADVGGDFFSADLFHTRDMVRQTVLDLMVLVRALRGLDGALRGAVDVDGDGQPELAGDFDGDGQVDLGGPSVEYYAWGTSLGAIHTSVLAGVEPALVAAAPQAGGGGLLDIAGRTTQSEVRRGAIIRTMGPVIYGEPGAEPGQIDVHALVIRGNNDDAEPLLVAGVEVAPGDRLELENLRSGEKTIGCAGADGGFRLSIAADALTPAQKRVRFGIELGDPPVAGEPVELADTTAAGDRLVLRTFDGETGEAKAIVDTFGEDVDFEGLRYPKGQPLVALSWGLGHPRNSPGLRQLLGLAQLALDPADPINYARHYHREPLPADYDEGVEPGLNYLLIATAGDTTVPVATAVALGRAAGIVSYDEEDPRFGKPLNEVLIEAYVLEGLSRLKRFEGQEVVADPEDFSRGVHAPEAPRLEAPLRAEVDTGRGVAGLRIPLINPKGQHAFLIPNPTAAFDNNMFLIHMVARYLSSGGRELTDEVCMADASCGWIPAPSPPADPGE